MTIHSTGKEGNQLQIAPSNEFKSTERTFPWGCLLGGCLTVLVLMIGGVAATGVAGYWFYKGQLAKYTSEEAKELPVVEISPEEVAAIEQRIENFKENVDKGGDTDELVLTADDINALISSDEDLKGRVYVVIGNGQVSADVSFPTDAIPGGKGRFFNGSVSVNVELRDGILIATVGDAAVNGQPVPDEYLAGIRKENLAKDLYKDVNSAKKLARLESIEIADDRIVLKVRKGESATAGESTTAGDAQAPAATSDEETGEPDAPIDSAAESPMLDEGVAEVDDPAQLPDPFRGSI